MKSDPIGSLTQRNETIPELIEGKKAWKWNNQGRFFFTSHTLLSLSNISREIVPDTPTLMGNEIIHYYDLSTKCWQYEIWKLNFDKNEKNARQTS